MKRTGMVWVVFCLLLVASLALAWALAGNEKKDNEAIKKLVQETVRESSDKENIEKLVLDVIRKNPDVVYQVVQAQEQKSKAEAAQKAFADTLKDRVTDPVRPENPSSGPADAPVTIVMYVDFQCPYCARGAKTMDDLLKKNPGKIRLVVKNFPLGFHKMALPAAKASMAASKQGKYFPYHDKLFQNVSRLSEALFVQTAQELGLDMEKFEADRNSPEIDRQIKADMADFRKAGLRGTPGFTVNGVVVKGAKSSDFFQKIIDHLQRENAAR